MKRKRALPCTWRPAALIAALAAALTAALLAGVPSAAQELPGLSDPKEAPVESEPLSLQEITARNAALAEELAANEKALGEARDKLRRAHLEEVRDALRSIDALLRQQAKLADPAAAQGPGPWIPSEAPAPSLFALDRLYEAQFEHEQEASRRAEGLASSREALAAAKEHFEEAERKRREARGELEKAQNSAARAGAERTLELRRLNSRKAQERVHLRTLETRLAQRAIAQWAPDPALAERIAQMRDALARDEGESADDFAALTEREAVLRQSRRDVERRLTTAELRLDAARQRFSRQADPPDELLEEVGALSAERDAVDQEIELLDTQLERLASQTTTWRQWDAVLRARATREDLASWKTAVAERTEALAQAEGLRRAKIADLERRLEAIQSRLRVLPEDARVRLVLEEHRAVLTRLLEAEQSEATEIAHDRRLSERLLAELRDRTGETMALEYVSRSLRAARDLWRYEITAVDDSAITVGSLALALLLATLGFWVSRYGSGKIGQIAVDRFRVDPGAAHALESVSFYILLVSFTMLALRAVHFPLTAFTVLGGALAIGIGFGSQNVMNNFISGLILMLERPVRARDIVEVDGNHGTIEKIGARSTQIRSNDGRHIIVPNSFFLETNVVNWTLSDDLIRTSVTVGVIYGSPTDLVEELIRRVVVEEEKVLERPAPIIIFSDFGDNALIFEVYFWVRARGPMEARVVQSRVRFRIDQLFRTHELVIAFPQRDVHLDSVAPIEVRVLNDSNRPEPQEAAG